MQPTPTQETSSRESKGISTRPSSSADIPTLAQNQQLPKRPDDRVSSSRSAETCADPSESSPGTSRYSENASTVQPEHLQNPKAEKVVVPLPLQTLATTFAASVISAGLTFPAEQWRLQWEGETLQQWKFDSLAEPRSNRILTPFVRLWTNHAASSILHSNLFTASATGAPNTSSLNQSLETQIMAGALAGVAQVAIFLPLQMRKIYLQHYKELEEVQTWRHFIKSQFSRGEGSWDPLEKHHRLLRGLGWVMGREIVFNVTFFPAFFYLQQEEWAWGSTYVVSGRPSLETLISSGMGAGIVSSMLVTPMDLLQVYFRHSREVWHWWRGMSLQAPPLPLLGRGLLLQACCFGPSFGLVAAIYELA